MVFLTLTHRDLARAIEWLVENPESNVEWLVGSHRDRLGLELYGHNPRIRPPRVFLQDRSGSDLSMVLRLVSVAGIGEFQVSQHNTIGLVPRAELTLLESNARVDAVARIHRPGLPVEPIDRVRLVGPGMQVLVGEDSPPSLSSMAQERWSRLIQSIGTGVWHRMVWTRFVIVGCGRTGSLVASALARMGVREIGLVDPDVVEEHNLDGMEGITPRDIGRTKVEAVADAFYRLESVQLIRTSPTSVTNLAALDLIRWGDVLISTLDDDGARWVSSALAAMYLKPHLDVGTGVLRQNGRIEVGADVRLTLPGEACLMCLGGLARPEQVATILGSGEDERLARAGRDWRNERAGSLRSLNQIAAGLGLRLLEDLFTGRVREPHWHRLGFDDRGIPSIENLAGARRTHCPICACYGMADAGLARLRSLVPTSP